MMVKIIKCPQCGYEWNRYSDSVPEIYRNWRCSQCHHEYNILENMREKEILDVADDSNPFVAPTQTEDIEVVEKRIGVLCGRHLKLESAIYAFFGSLIGIVLVTFSAIILGITYICVEAYKFATYVVRKIIGLIKWIVENVNWCVARSIARMVSLISEVVAIILIALNIGKYPSSSIFFMGFASSDPGIQFLHNLILFALVNVFFYAVVWTFTKEDEMRVVCKYTTRYTFWTKLLDKIWR